MNNADKPINPVLTQNPSLIGLSKREHFAGLAMQGMISNPNIVRPKESDKEFKDFSERAIKYADELLKQLEKNK